MNSVAQLNENMGVNLTYHDINWVYSCQDSKTQGITLELRPMIRLISCLPQSNKGLNEDFLLISGDWHDELHCPIIDEVLIGVFKGLGFFLVLFLCVLVDLFF